MARVPINTNRRDHILVALALIWLLFTGLFAWQGQPSDWLRHAVFAGVLLSGFFLRLVLGQWLGFYLMSCTVLLAEWHFADPAGFTRLHGFGSMDYGVVAFLLILGTSSQYGLRGGLSLTGLSALLLLALPHDERKIYAFFLMLIGLSAGLRYYVVFKELHEAQQALKRQAHLDQLTGLGNRHALMEASSIHNITMLTAWDVNDLKKVNDEHGHIAGDEYLLRFVRAWQSVAGARDVLYRVGGDEFIGLHRELADPADFVRRVQRVFPQVAVGWCAYTGDLDATIRDADHLMYAMKAEQKRVVGGEEATSDQLSAASKR